MRYILILTLSLVLCFAAQALALRTNGGRFTKSESNFFSSIGRIQAGIRDEPEIMILGSSITGRLPDRANGFAGVANMGCDGGSAIDILRAMNDGILSPAPLLLIEANTMHLALDPFNNEISKAMRGAWFRIGMRFPFLSAYGRPSAFFYSKLLERRIGEFDLRHDEDLGVRQGPGMVPESTKATLDPKQTALIGECSEIISNLRAEGVGLALVWLPPARAHGSDPPDWIIELAYRCGIPFWDLGGAAGPEKVRLTDGVHMDARSATRTMRNVLKFKDQF